MNFESLTIQRFKVGVDIYKRIYQVAQKNNGKLRVYSVIDGAILFDNLNPNEVQIDGVKMRNIDQLQNIIFNKSCVCENEVDDMDHKIFDRTFDKTFE